MKKAIWIVLHIVIINLVKLGLYGHKFTHCKNLDNDKNCRIWVRSQMTINKIAKIATDQGNLICCHGDRNGLVVDDRAISIAFMTLFEELKGDWKISCCFTGDDYEDEEVKVERINRKEYVCWNEWSWDGSTYYTYSNAVMHRLAVWAGILN